MSTRSARPGPTCYYTGPSYAQFLADPTSSIIGFIEIKFASPLNGDLQKLATLQHQHDCVAWMVYGDHFMADMHASNARAQSKRTEQIVEWTTDDWARGATILKCGDVQPDARNAESASILEALRTRNGDFWKAR